MINARKDWRGFLWQGRFSSFVLQNNYLLAAVKYVELNPVRAGIASSPEQYPWSSAKTHISKQNDSLLSHFYLLDEIKDWTDYLKTNENVNTLNLFRKHQSSGRPLGDW